MLKSTSPLSRVLPKLPSCSFVPCFSSNFRTSFGSTKGAFFRSSACKARHCASVRGFRCILYSIRINFNKAVRNLYSGLVAYLTYSKVLLGKTLSQRAIAAVSPSQPLRAPLLEAWWQGPAQPSSRLVRSAHIFERCPANSYGKGSFYLHFLQSSSSTP